jgi:uncharacterized protein (TIGR00369 family)
MISSGHYEKLQKMYLNALCNDYYQPQIKISQGTAEVIIPVAEKFFHAANAVHGSVYFKIMDDAAFFAANSLVPDVSLLTVSFNINFIRPVTSGKMKAMGKVIYHSGKYFFSESIVYDSKGREIARGSGNFVKSAVPLSDEIGYKL